MRPAVAYCLAVLPGCRRGGAAPPVACRPCRIQWRRGPTADGDLDSLYPPPPSSPSLDAPAAARVAARVAARCCPTSDARLRLRRRRWMLPAAARRCPRLVARPLPPDDARRCPTTDAGRSACLTGKTGGGRNGRHIFGWALVMFRRVWKSGTATVERVTGGRDD